MFDVCGPVSRSDKKCKIAKCRLANWIHLSQASPILGTQGPYYSMDHLIMGLGTVCLLSFTRAIRLQNDLHTETKPTDGQITDWKCWQSLIPGEWLSHGHVTILIESSNTIDTHMLNGTYTHVDMSRDMTKPIKWLCAQRWQSFCCFCHVAAHILDSTHTHVHI